MSLLTFSSELMNRILCQACFVNWFCRSYYISIPKNDCHRFNLFVKGFEDFWPLENFFRYSVFRDFVTRNFVTLSSNTRHPLVQRPPVGVNKLKTRWKQRHRKSNSGQTSKTTAAEKICFKLKSTILCRQLILKYHKLLYRLTERTVEHVSHSGWTEFGRNSSPVWIFYFGGKRARVWLTHLSNISSNFFSAKQAGSTAAHFSFFRCCCKRRISISVAINTRLFTSV